MPVRQRLRLTVVWANDFARLLNLWAGKDLNLRRQMPADLQSAPFGRLGTDP